MGALSWFKSGPPGRRLAKYNAPTITALVFFFLLPWGPSPRCNDALTAKHLLSFFLNINIGRFRITYAGGVGDLFKGFPPSQVLKSYIRSELPLNRGGVVQEASEPLYFCIIPSHDTLTMQPKWTARNNHRSSVGGSQSCVFFQDTVENRLFTHFLTIWSDLSSFKNFPLVPIKFSRNSDRTNMGWLGSDHSRVSKRGKHKWSTLELHSLQCAFLGQQMHWNWGCIPVIRLIAVSSYWLHR